jgi:hypothetical protein
VYSPDCQQERATEALPHCGEDHILAVNEPSPLRSLFLDKTRKENKKHPEKKWAYYACRS